MNTKERMEELKVIVEKESGISEDEILEKIEPMAIERYSKLLNSKKFDKKEETDFSFEDEEVETDGLFRSGTILSENQLADNEEIHEFMSIVIRKNGNATLHHHKDFVFVRNNFQLNKNNFSFEIGYKHTDDEKEVNVIRTKVLEYLDIMMIDENDNETETVFSNMIREMNLDINSDNVQTCIFDFREDRVGIVEYGKVVLERLTYEEIAEEILSFHMEDE